MKAEIIAVGSELLTPDRVDTNSLFLTARLNRLGIEVTRKTVVGDDLAPLRNAFDEACKRVDLVIASGGLGPTEDDRTRDAVADLFGRKLSRDPAVMSRIEARFRQIGRKMSEVNARQAMVPEGAIVLDNDRGTAPGLWLEAGGRIIILLPGVPSELKSIFEAQVRQRLERISSDERLFTRDLRITGLGESDVETRVRPLYELYPDSETTILASPGAVQLHPRVWSRDAKKAEQILDEITKRMALALGEHLYSMHGEALEEVVGRILTENRATIAVAESCTGGMLAERLTNLGGSSAYFLGGVVCYSNDLKTSMVGVPKELIETKGAVSSEVALALADGIRKRTGATIGIGITGIAGPTGGTPEKPVGLVHIGIADERGPRERAYRYPGNRERIRNFATQSALDVVRRHFLFPTSPRA